MAHHQCIECKGYAANYCNTYDEVTKPDSEVQCIGFDPSETCDSCCYKTEKEGNCWCEFYNKETSGERAACEAWEPKIEI